MKKDKDITYINLEDEERDVSGMAAASAPESRPVGGGIQARRGSNNNRKKKKRLKPGQITHIQKVGSVLAVVGTTFLTIFLIAVITICIVAVALTVYIMQFAENSFDIDLRAAEMNYTSFIMVFDPDAGEDGEGDWVEVKRLSGDENRIWIDIGEMPQHLIDAVIANEDHRFYEHDGVDWYGTVGVIFREMFSDEEIRGASTITQQLVKNVTGDDRVTAGRKLREIFRALSLEQKYTKLDILESYLNRIGFGGTSSGVVSAAWYYFEKDVRDISIAEAALMAGVIPSPHNWNPYINSRSARIRQEEALNQMYIRGFITTAQYEEALAEPLRFRNPVRGDYFGYEDPRYNEWWGLQGLDDDETNLYFQDTPWEQILPLAYKWNGDYEVTQNWYVDAGIWQVATKLAGQRGVSYERAMELIRSGGYTIYLNVDIKMQERLEEIFLDPMNFLRREVHPNTPHNDLLQGAFVVMDYSGRVLALAGGFGEKPGDNCFNRATQSVRSIGSTIKPLVPYAPAINMNIINYSTFTRDASGEIHSNPNDRSSPLMLWPYNFGQANIPGSGRYYPTWYSMQKSLNTVSVRTLSKVGFRDAFSFLVDKVGFSDLCSLSDVGWSPLALGAFTEGTRLHELTAAYAIFGNGGIYYEPYLFDRVIDNTGRVVLEQNLIGTQAIEKDSAWVMNRILRTVVTDPAGTGRLSSIENIEVVGKTGTSNDMKNLLWCALTPDYVASYRFGYDLGREMEDWSLDNWISPAGVWGYIMTELSDTTVPRQFTPDSSVVVLSYCNETGLIATSRCPSTSIGHYRQSFVPRSCDAAEHDGTGEAYWAIHGDPEGFRPFYN
ncbi:MAG: transglycosylase domain-containing protein [Oscillospiraceae bacterium]|jgi:penicillin-binding protein 1A|nr:transglycosylase domain-containing protein [Oscillospiraceae bacterium]